MVLLNLRSSCNGRKLMKVTIKDVDILKAIEPYQLEIVAESSQIEILNELLITPVTYP